MRRISRIARLPVYVGSVVTVGSVALVLSCIAYPPTPSLMLLFLGVTVVLSESIAVRLPNGGTQSISYPLFIAILLLDGPSSVALAAVGASMFADTRAQKSLMKVVFNAAQLALSAVLAGWVFSTAAAGLGLSATDLALLPPRVFPAVLVPTLLYSIVVFTLNSALVSLAISISERRSLPRVWLGSYSWQALTQLALTLLGLALAKLVFLEGLLGLLVFSIPMLVSRGVFQSYVGLRDAYADTVRGLVTAIEAKDPYTGGHSERVSQLAKSIASTMGMSEAALERLELSALLHDLGKVGIGRSILQKPSSLSPEEFEAVRSHPRIAAEIVGSIAFLQEAIPAIVHHHERWDGHGYVAGLSGEEIPLHARILAVADSYDAMTSERPYKRPLTHEGAVREIETGAGGQFDPAIVDVFTRFLESDRTAEDNTR